MLIKCIKNVCNLWRREPCNSGGINNEWKKQLESIMETVGDVKQDLMAAKVLAERAVGKLNILDEKISVLQKKVSDGLGATAEEMAEIGALSRGVKDALTGVDKEVDEASALADPAVAPTEPVVEPGTGEGTGEPTPE